MLIRCLYVCICIIDQMHTYRTVHQIFERITFNAHISSLSLSFSNVYNTIIYLYLIIFHYSLFDNVYILHHEKKTLFSLFSRLRECASYRKNRAGRVNCDFCLKRRVYIFVANRSIQTSRCGYRRPSYVNPNTVTAAVGFYEPSFAKDNAENRMDFKNERRWYLDGRWNDACVCVPRRI